MAKKIPNRSIRPVAKRGVGYAKLVKAISQVNTGMVARAAVAVNQALVLRNWLIGAYIVEFEQNGADRAKYGARLLETLAADLKAQGIKGLGARTLWNCKSFFSLYPQIRQPAVAAFSAGALGAGILQTAFAESDAEAVTCNSANSVCGIGQPLVGKLKPPRPVTDFVATGGGIRQTMVAKLPTQLEAAQLARISWAHFLELNRLDDPWKRAFYENELLRGHWSVRQLQRQIGSLLYERTGLSTNKKAVIERARKQERQETVEDMLRDPYVLEFTGLAERPEYSEGELETALLDHLQRFLLELGRGFCFEARQFRMTEGRKHHRVDLVFYHRILRCHVLIDLKIRSFKPEDAGQMNFYVNWFKANMMHEGDNPPVGILLCSDKDGTEVEFATAGMDQKLFVSRYLVALPSVEKLRHFLEADRERIESLMPPPSARKRAPRKPKS
jgi:predicted nuclease of restriction endonuclease-like (RecB) superfamily